MPFTYVSVDSVIPRTGPTTGAQDVTIRGFGFNAATGVTFGGSAATNVVIVSNTTITATTPAHSSGSVDVAVLGVDTGFDLYTYTIAQELLPPIPYRVPPVSPIPHLIAREWMQWLQAVKQRVEEPVTIGPGQVTGFPLSRVNDTNVTLTLTGTPDTALLEAVTLTLGWTGTLSAARGGLGPLTITKGDLLYADLNTHWATLADVSVGSYLRSGGVATAPLWSTLKLPNSATTGDLLYASAADTISNLAAVAAGRVLRAAGVGAAPAYSTFTIPDTFAQGDLIYGSAANVLTALAKNTTATRYLSNTGASNNPAWAQVDLTNGVTGILPAANGGTGAGTYAVGDLLYADTTSTLARLADVAAGSYLRSGGVNTAPLWSTLTLPNTITVNQIPYATGTNAIGSSTGLIFDGTNLGIGLSIAPTEIIHINSATRPGVRFLLAGVFRGYFGVDNNNYFTTAPSGDFIISTGGNIRFGSSSSTGEKFCIDNTTGNVSLGLLTQPGAGTKGIIIPDGTAFSSMASNTCGLYGDDVGGTVEVFAIDEADGVARLTGTTARNSAQFDKTNTTLANITGLTTNLAAGITYAFVAILFVSADVTGGSKFAMSGTATATAIRYSIELLDYTTNAYTIADTQTALGGSSAQAGTTTGICYIRGTITVNGAGTLTAQYAQSAASGTSSILANSTMKIEQVP